MDWLLWRHATLRSAAVIITLFTATLALSGCAALRGSAKPVTAVDTRVAYATTFPEEKVYPAFYRKGDACDANEAWPACRDGLGKVEFRNMVTALYMSAADARYQEFRDSLAQESKGTAFGGNITVLLLNGISVVSGNEARRALAAASAVVSGGQASVSKDLFIEKALPAVLASMDANRSEAKAGIISKLRLDATQYSLPDAISDVRGLEGKARLEEAIQKLTATATADAADKKKLMDVAYTVKLQGPLAPRKQALLLDIEALDHAKMQTAAGKLGATVDATSKANQAANIRIWMSQNVQGEKAFDTAVAAVKDLTGKDSYP